MKRARSRDLDRWVGFSFIPKQTDFLHILGSFDWRKHGPGQSQCVILIVHCSQCNWSNNSSSSMDERLSQAASSGQGGGALIRRYGKCASHSKPTYFPFQSHVAESSMTWGSLSDFARLQLDPQRPLIQLLLHPDVLRNVPLYPVLRLGGVKIGALAL